MCFIISHSSDWFFWNSLPRSKRTIISSGRGKMGKVKQSRMRRQSGKHGVVTQKPKSQKTFVGGGEALYKLLLWQCLNARKAILQILWSVTSYTGIIHWNKRKQNETLRITEFQIWRISFSGIEPRNLHLTLKVCQLDYFISLRGFTWMLSVYTYSWGFGQVLRAFLAFLIFWKQGRI
jgi:hypothetical protein